MSNIRFRNISLGALAATLILLAMLSPVAAQQNESAEAETGVEVVAGPHAVRVVILNSNLAAGFVQMAFFVTDANTGGTVPGKPKVTIKANNDKEEYQTLGTAHNSPSNPQRYDGRMNLGSTGEWLIGVDVSSPLGQGGADALILEVPALNRYTDGSLVFFGIFAAMMLGVVYLIWSVKRQNRRRPGQSEIQG